jgi:Protein of unknown function (DUF3455)
MHKANGAIALFAMVVSSSCFPSVSTNAQQVPKELQPPPDQQLLFKVHAKGDQIYVCKSDGAQFVWTLKGPEAQLFDAAGKPFGEHFTGPSWQANDGSTVTGKAAANAPSPDADSVPWLLLAVVSRDGDGVLSRATSIQRINTKGGKAPASGCDAAHSGQEARAAYSADYVFFAPK